MNETATVAAIDGTDIYIKVQAPEGGCAGCMNKDTCKSGAALVKAINQGKAALQVGDAVKIAVPGKSLWKEALFSIGVPIAAAVLAWLAGSAAGLSDAAGGALTALTLLLAGLVIYLIRRRFPAKTAFRVL
jgi:positive regulator of sigma E activity